MSIKSYLFAFVSLLAICSCGHEEKKDDRSFRSEAEESGIHRSHVYNHVDTIHVGSHEYICTVHRESDDSLKAVTDENGSVYIDNHYDLSIIKDGSSFFRHRFTKASFGSQLDEGFRKNGILDGFRYLKSEDGKLFFSVCVSYPDSDMSNPFFLTIGPDGSFVLEPDNIMDVEEENDSTSV